MLQEIMLFVSRNTILSLAWVALLIAVIVMTFKSRFSKVKEIGRGQATLMINKEDAVIVDIRSRDDFRKGHIANAINLTASEIKSGSFGELEKHKAQPVIVVCANGTTSRASAENLSKAGFENVYTLKDGITGWSGENLPLARGK
ncbi:rhodanese-like domain-containing protein [Serratia sp. DD3]|uniref:rhodanese-like domain-containing protein n=1 Tax=Serratia sp. DD3 TaxID=1410619 RepID=UPI0003C51C9D|nr:rhodanese-like domain-containing protein [Serratia sp. DD3]KEY56500.1 thiosulfate sulfurtransferase GlpE [Serratia sp. DD3]KEY56720.1 thiosulfate sulfurtransferase GlpE [Serratia sp. DD3]KEY58347.1 thiosulfate sulfurtransferase GlpE [Serratia sp. DD3]KEY59431.1 thiosulfate sulfurtransferase GlpE [Serratia sp. DD3]